VARIPTGGPTIGVTGWPDHFMSNDLITFDVPMDEAAAAWWVDRFRVGDRTLYPEQLAARIAQGLPGKLRCHLHLGVTGAGSSQPGAAWCGRFNEPPVVPG
jgi:hypothetical protein